MLADLVPGISIIAVLIVVFGFILLMRYIRYKETLALAEKGLARPEERRPNKPLLRWGIIVAALGLALTLGLFPIGFGNGGPRYPFGLGPWMLAGLIPLFVGLGLVLTHYLTQKDD